MENLGVYKAIAGITAKIAQTGIAKNRKNQQQGYNFRGVDDVYNALAPILAENNLVIIPFCENAETTERQSRKGDALFYTKVYMKYMVTCATDGSHCECRITGEAMDSADKSTNKAMSAAYKYLCFQLFCIPTGGDNDADGSTPEPAPAKAPAPVKMITDEQFARLQELGADMINLAKACHVNSVTKLTYEQAAQAIAKKEQLNGAQNHD